MAYTTYNKWYPKDPQKIYRQTTGLSCSRHRRVEPDPALLLDLRLEQDGINLRIRLGLVRTAVAAGGDDLEGDEVDCQRKDLRAVGEDRRVDPEQAHFQVSGSVVGEPGRWVVQKLA